MSSPELTVVIPSVNGWPDLEGCLEALDAERGETRLEVLVADRIGPDLWDRTRERFPWVRLVEAPPGTTIPELRAAAFDEATAPSVAVIEDHVQVPKGWARALLTARMTAPVVGGGVRNSATERLVDWAAFLCEYSHLLPPLASGEVSWLTGNNTVYDLELLRRFRDVTHAGWWEHRLHDAFRAAGIPLCSAPEIVVDHKKHYTVGEYMEQRYLYARSYAGARVAGAPVLRRVAFGLAAWALPPLLLGRIVFRTLRKEVDQRLLWQSLPLLFLFVCAWGAGEVVGYWFGPGDSLSRVC